MCCYVVMVIPYVKFVKINHKLGPWDYFNLVQRTVGETTQKPDNFRLFQMWLV